MAPRIGSAEANRRPGASRSGTWMTAMSKSGSKNTTVPSSRRSVGRGHADGATVRPGDDVGVGHDVVGSDGETRPDRRIAARGRRDLDGARDGALGQATGGGVVGPVDGRRRDRFEPDEDGRQAGAVEQPAQLDRELGGGRQQGVEDADGARRLGRLGQARDRPEGEEPTDQPHDEDGLRDPDERSRRPGRPRPARRCRGRARPDGRSSTRSIPRARPR